MAVDGEVLPLLQRVRSEFLEMPGLRLTPNQAARLWALDRTTSERVLDGLVDAGFLGRSRDGAYLRASAA
jgi:DNA-binding MarR family transcriptional regulator